MSNQMPPIHANKLLPSGSLRGKYDQEFIKQMTKVIDPYQKKKTKKNANNNHPQLDNITEEKSQLNYNQP